MLQNASFLAIVAVDTAETQPSKVRYLDRWVRCDIGSEPHFPEDLAVQPPRFRKDEARAQPEQLAGAAKVLDQDAS